MFLVSGHIDPHPTRELHLIARIKFILHSHMPVMMLVFIPVHSLGHEAAQWARPARSWRLTSRESTGQHLHSLEALSCGLRLSPFWPWSLSVKGNMACLGLHVMLPFICSRMLEHITMDQATGFSPVFEPKAYIVDMSASKLCM